MRPNRNVLQTHLILPLGFGWTSTKQSSSSSISQVDKVSKSETEGLLLLEQIKML
ncbi:hypothetical protein [Lentiprolixibacter aurantiacus]|uniref:Uncharacterized protein n=1 Tax=Lentiprolixibacter aurantiacus TaxID=2993939 RepID=A0AAE3SNT3_9FLAO|nr:hypothetical protein [Lentiprolixibacter aurantiacus]MCX2718802.1 hypothetical protein [Lentiprolixibacter aurantiacus]